MFKPINRDVKKRYETLYHRLDDLLKKDEFWEKPTKDGLDILGKFLRSSNTLIETRGLEKNQKKFIMNFYQGACNIQSHLLKGPIPKNSKAKTNEGTISIPEYMSRNISGLYIGLTRSDLLPTQNKLKAFNRDVDQFTPTIEKLREALGSKIFVKYPKLRWERSNGAEGEGTVLEMQGFFIPQANITWFKKRLEGKFAFDFQESNKGKYVLRILNVQNSQMLLISPESKEGKLAIASLFRKMKELKFTKCEVVVLKKSGIIQRFFEFANNKSLKSNSLSLGKELYDQFFEENMGGKNISQTVHQLLEEGLAKYRLEFSDHMFEQFVDHLNKLIAESGEKAQVFELKDKMIDDFLQGYIPANDLPEVLEP